MGILCTRKENPLKLSGFGTVDLAETFLKLVVSYTPDTLKIFTASTGERTALQTAAEVSHRQAAGIILVINLSTRAEP